MQHESRPHPITGAPMFPLGYSNKGKAIWPVAGGSTPAGEPSGGTGTGGTPPAGTGSTTPAATPPAATPPAGEQPSLTQSQVNALLAEERRKTETRVASKYGDYDTLKDKAGKFDATEAENATTLERATKTARQEGAAEVLAKANGLLVNAEVRALAAAAKFRNPLDALALLQSSGALAGVKVSEDGVVDSAAVKTALDALATERAYLIDTGTTPPPPPTPGAAGVGAGSTNKVVTEKGMGTLRHAYGATTPKT